MMSPVGPSPNPNVPSEYCSTIPPLQQARAAGTLNSPPPTVMVPVSVLKHPNHDGTAALQQKSLASPPLFLQMRTRSLPLPRLSPRAEARVVRRRHPAQRGGGRHHQAVGEQPPRLPGVQRRRLGPNICEDSKHFTFFST